MSLKASFGSKLMMCSDGKADRFGDVMTEICFATRSTNKAGEVKSNFKNHQCRKTTARRFLDNKVEIAVEVTVGQDAHGARTIDMRAKDTFGNPYMDFPAVSWTEILSK